MQKELLPRLLAVKVPKDATDIEAHTMFIDENNKCPVLDWFNKEMEYGCEYLPPGDWQLLGRVSEIGEEVAAGIVEPFELPENGGTRYPDYTQGYLWFKHARNSLHSLVRSQGFEPEEIVLLKNNVV